MDVDTYTSLAQAGQTDKPTEQNEDASAPAAPAPEPEQVSQQAEAVGEEPEAPVAPPQPTLAPEQIEERVFQRVSSWTGRRDRELMDHIEGLLDRRLATMQPPQQQLPPSDPATILENPEQWARSIIPKILDEEVTNRVRREQQYNADVIQQAASIMESDPIFANRDFGAAVIKEMEGGFGRLDKRLPSRDAARLLVSEATANIVRKATMAARQNGLAKNKPVSGPIGGITPPAAAKPKPRVEELSEEALRMAKRLRMSDEDVQRALAK